MSEKTPIHQHEPYSEAGEHDHTGMRSHRRRLDSFANRFREWRDEREIAHAQGHQPPPEVCFDGESPAQHTNPYFPEGADQEITLFDPGIVGGFNRDEARLAEVRQELAGELVDQIQTEHGN